MQTSRGDAATRIFRGKLTETPQPVRLRRYPDEQAFQIPPSLAKKVAAGKLGRKSGEGYYLWGDGPASTKPTGLSGLE